MLLWEPFLVVQDLERVLLRVGLHLLLARPAKVDAAASPASQGLTLAHFRAQLEVLRDTSLTLELNLSTFGTHPRVNLGYMGDKVSLS